MPCSSTGHFLYIQPEPDSDSEAFAQIVSPLYQVLMELQCAYFYGLYQDSAANCYFNFFVYISDQEPLNRKCSNSLEVTKACVKLRFRNLNIIFCAMSYCRPEPDANAESY